MMFQASFEVPMKSQASFDAQSKAVNIVHKQQLFSIFVKIYLLF